MGFTDVYLDLMKSGKLERFSYWVHLTIHKKPKVYTTPFIIVHIILYLIGIGLFFYIIGQVIDSPSPISKTIGMPDYQNYIDHNESVLYTPICVFDRPSIPMYHISNISLADITISINTLEDAIWKHYFPQNVTPPDDLIKKCRSQVCSAGCTDQKIALNCTSKESKIIVPILDQCMQLLFGNMGETTLSEICASAISYTIPLQGLVLTFHSLPSPENLKSIIRETTLSFSRTYLGALPAVTSSSVAISAMTSALDINAAAKAYPHSPDPLVTLYSTIKDRFENTQDCVQIAGQIGDIPLDLLKNKTLLEQISTIYADRVVDNLYGLQNLLNKLEPIQCVFVIPPGVFTIVTEALSRALPVFGLYLLLVKFPLHFIENQIWKYQARRKHVHHQELGDSNYHYQSP